MEMTYTNEIIWKKNRSFPIFLSIIFLSMICLSMICLSSCFVCPLCT